MKGGCTETTTNVAGELSTFLTTVKGALADFTTVNLATILVAGLALAVGPAIAWFGYRWVKGKVSKAFFKGKL